MQADATAGCHDDLAIVEGIDQVGQAAILTPGWRVDLGRALHIECFVRPFSIELADEIVEFCLLLQAIHRWRPGGFFLEREMHALMPSILLGMAGFDALDRNAEP